MCEQVRELTNDVAPEPFRWTAEGLLALQEVHCLYFVLPYTLPSTAWYATQPCLLSHTLFG